MDRTYRIVVADDSLLYRKILRRVLDAHPGLSVVHVAADGAEAVEAVQKEQPDGVVLDINMPRMNGFEALEKVLETNRRLPVVMISAGAAHDAKLAIQAVALGAVDLFVKPAAEPGKPISKELGPLAELVARACDGLARRPADQRAPPVSRPAVPQKCDVIAVGASTGGVHALARLIESLGPKAPPVVIAQHMPYGFTQSLAAQLQLRGTVDVVESAPGMTLEPGRAIVCTTNDRHTVVSRGPGTVGIDWSEAPKENFQRPAVDVLFRSIAKIYRNRALGILLTGMGRDGAEGLKAIREAGGTTIAESARTAVVFGMPKAAIDLGAAEHVLALDEIADVLKPWAARS